MVIFVISRLILYALTIVKYRMIVPATRGAQFCKGDTRASRYTIVERVQNACRTENACDGVCVIAPRTTGVLENVRN